MSTPRNACYIWPTWICGLLSGENHCEYAPWFRAHYRDYDKAPRNVDLTMWTAEHNAMVRKRSEELRVAGYTVYVEDQNGFALRGTAATLGGKADIVAILHGGQDTCPDDQFAPANRTVKDALVVDCKSGQPRDKDIFQVLIYMLVLPFAVPHCKGLTLRGELDYKGSRVEIAADRLTPEVNAMIRSTIERVAGEAPLPVVPSAHECRFCDLTTADCKQRIDVPAAEAVATDLW